MANTTDYQVGDWLVRPSLSQIESGKERHHVEPRSMAVLVELCCRAPEVASKQELIEAVWGEAFVSDEVLTHAIWDLRRVFGDDASSPRFIQTIPKKGYRLIAEVKEIEPAQTARRLPSWQRLLVLLMATLAVGVLATYLAGRRSAEESPVAAVSLLLVPAPQSLDEGPAGQAKRRLEDDIATRLSGISRSQAEFSRAECGPRSGWTVYCLTIDVRPGDADGLEARVQVAEAESGHLPFSTRWLDLPVTADFEQPTRELSEQVTTFLEVRADDFYDDPDVAPFFEVNRHDIRAIREFFLGLHYSFRDEAGSVSSWERAIKIDPEFVAPHVSRAPDLRIEGDPEAIAAHRKRLAGLLEVANGFERPMLRWADAFLTMPKEPTDPRLPESLALQKRELEVALDRRPGNRLVRSMLASVHSLRGQHEEAWELLEPLIEEGWNQPDHYQHAAKSALELGRLRDARNALELGLALELVDPETYGLLTLFAVFDNDSDAAARALEHFRVRTADLTPDSSDFDWGYYADLLARAAEERGNDAAARRLREFLP